jgi:hypothetical protein
MSVLKSLVGNRSSLLVSLSAAHSSSGTKLMEQESQEMEPRRHLVHCQTHLIHYHTDSLQVDVMTMCQKLCCWLIALALVFSLEPGHLQWYVHLLHLSQIVRLHLEQPCLSLFVSNIFERPSGFLLSQIIIKYRKEVMGCHRVICLVHRG